MNKNILCVSLLLLLLLFTYVQETYAVSSLPKINTNAEINIDDNDNRIYSEDSIIKRISLRNKFKKSPETEITNFFKKYNKYSEENNFKKLKEMYTDNYLNNDGFDKQTVFKMMEMSSDSYKNVKYSTDIKSIKVDGRYAIVEAKETATAYTDNLIKKINDTGLVNSSVEYIDYLVKEGNKWKIQATYILDDEVSVKYGEAKTIDTKISVPNAVVEGSSYDASINIDIPSEAFAIGSIVNEKIVFPQEETKEVFKVIKHDKLTRVLTANKQGYNEYVSASVAVTRTEVEPGSLNINMTGLAFTMKRVNVISSVKLNGNNNVDE